MRILFLIETLRAPGGAERQLVTLATELARGGDECHVAVTNPSSDLEPELATVGIKLHRLGGHQLSRAPLALANLVKLERRLRPQVVHSHLRSAALLSALAGICGGCAESRIVVLHNPDYDMYPPRNVGQWCAKILHGHCIRRLSDGAVAVSSAVAESYDRRMNIQASVIPNAVGTGIDVPAMRTLRPATRVELGVGDADFVIAYAARMVFQKGHRQFLDAIGHLKIRGKKPIALLMARGPLESKIRQHAADIGVESQVRFLGDLPHHVALRYIAACDLFASASSFEGFGIAVAEAMLLGIPTVATRIGGLRDVTGHGGAILVEVADVAAMANAIETLMTDEAARTRAGLACQIAIGNRFSAATVAAAWQEYLGVLATHRRGKHPSSADESSSSPASGSLSQDQHGRHYQRAKAAFFRLAAAREGMRLGASARTEGSVAIVVALHRVSPISNAFWPPIHPAVLERAIEELGRLFHFATLFDPPTAAPGRPSLIFTFDDGYRDFVTYAAPILARFGIRANLNLVGTCVRSGIPIWNVRLYDFFARAPRSLISELRLPAKYRIPQGANGAEFVAMVRNTVRDLKMMKASQRRIILSAVEPVLGKLDPGPGAIEVLSANELKEIAESHDIGCHSDSHESFGQEDQHLFDADLEDSQRFFSSQVGLPFRIYAFPNGSHRPAQITQLLNCGAERVLLMGQVATTLGSKVMGRVNLYGSSPGELVARASGFGANLRPPSAIGAPTRAEVT